MKKLKPLFAILTAALILFSAVCFLYPAISNAINEQYNESRIDDYNNNVDSISQEDIDDYFSAAEKYNKALATDVSTDDSKLSILSHYDEILDLDNGVMGYVEIPSINVRLPVYHGESEDILEKGTAHLEHTSFPIGGESTHACISAHCGYPTQKFFDDIDELENGEEIYIYVLDRTLKYTVTDSDVVEPDDSSKLEVVQGKDMLTLVTCTPYGVNSHRLLVHAERAPFEAATSDSAATVSEITRTVPKSHQLQIIIAGLDYAYDTSGNIITYHGTVTHDGITVGTPGEELCRIYADGKDAYCIQPGYSLYSGNTLIEGQSSVWDGVSKDKQKAVNIALLYGKPGNAKNLGGTDGQKWIATQVIVWEILCGCRNTGAGFKCTNTKFIDALTAGDHNPGVKSVYNTIANAMANHHTVPSFASNLASSAPTHTMQYSKLFAYLGDYQMAVYLYAFSSYVEVLLLGNFEEGYIKRVMEKVEQYALDYRELFTEVSAKLEKFSKDSVKSNAMRGFGNVSKFLGQAASNVPLFKDNKIDKGLVNNGEFLEKAEVEFIQSVSKELSVRRSVDVSAFLENLRMINNLYNHPVQMLFDTENVYLKQIA